MENKYLLICSENLKAFSSLLQTIKEKAPFPVEIAKISDILKGKMINQLKEHSISNIFIAVEMQTFAENEQELRDYCNSIEESDPFTNFLYIHPTKESLVKNEPSNMNKYEYIFFDHKEHDAQAIQFILYMINLYSKSILSNRLADYIYHSFKEVVFYEVLKKQKADIEVLNEELAKKTKLIILLICITGEPFLISWKKSEAAH